MQKSGGKYENRAQLAADTDGGRKRDSDCDSDSDVGNINKALILIVSGISPD